VTKNLVDFTAAWRIDISYGCPLLRMSLSYMAWAAKLWYGLNKLRFLLY